MLSLVHHTPCIVHLSQQSAERRKEAHAYRHTGECTHARMHMLVKYHTQRLTKINHMYLYFIKPHIHIHPPIHSNPSIAECRHEWGRMGNSLAVTTIHQSTVNWNYAQSTVSTSVQNWIQAQPMTPMTHVTSQWRSDVAAHQNVQGLVRVCKVLAELQDLLWFRHIHHMHKHLLLGRRRQPNTSHTNVAC